MIQRLNDRDSNADDRITAALYLLGAALWAVGVIVFVGYL